MTIAAKIAEFALNSFSKKLPKNILDITTQAIIDQYGLQIGGSQFPWSKSVLNYAREQSTAGYCDITHYGDKVSPTLAAFVNGSFAHAQDFDDSHQEAQTHPGSVVIPAAVAIAQTHNIPGDKTLKSIAIGMEVMLRLSHSISPACIKGGHHTPPTVGPFGAAIASGLLLGLDEEQLTNALGICGSYAGGLVEYTLSGGSVKRIHTGIGARNGVEACLLAQKGITGPQTIIEGDKGMWTVFGRGNAYPDRLFSNIGQKYLLSSIMFKPFNCCFLIHPAIEGFVSLCKEHDIHADDIEQVTVGMSSFSLSHAGKITVPTDILGAQFSTSYTLALSLLVQPPGMHTYTDELIKNEEILALTRKITVVEDDDVNNAFPKENGCSLTVKTNDKKTYQKRVRTPKGSPENPMTEEDVKQKFMNNISEVRSKAQGEALHKKLLMFGSLDSIKNLTTASEAHMQVSMEL